MGKAQIMRGHDKLIELMPSTYEGSDEDYYVTPMGYLVRMWLDKLRAREPRAVNNIGNIGATASSKLAMELFKKEQASE